MKTAHWFGFVVLALTGGYFVFRKQVNNVAVNLGDAVSDAVVDLGGVVTGLGHTVSSWVLSARSEARMTGVHTDLKAVVRRALELSPYDFGITAGCRTASEQNALYQSGASTLDGYRKISRHQTGHAIDFVAYDENGRVTWSMEYYEAIANAFKQAAREQGTPIVWGGDWTSFVDGPHIELSSSQYA